MSKYFARASSNDNVCNRCISTLRTCKVSPTLAMAQILPLTNPSTSVRGTSTYWQSSWDSKPCWAWRHSFTLTISSSCSLVAFLSKGFGKAFDQTLPRFCRFVSVHKQTEKLALNIECHEFYKLYPRQPAVLLYDTWQPLIACNRAGRAGQFIVSCFLHPNPSHGLVVGQVRYVYALQLQLEHLYVL